MMLWEEIGMIKLTVNQSGFAALKSQIRDTSAVFAAVGAFADSSLQTTQSSGQDPYQETWAPLATGSPSFLRDQGTLEASRAWESSRNRARVTFGAAYAQFHQSGTSKMPQRKLVPESMPPHWEGTITRIVERWANRL